ncbi:hypothetical protein AcW1_001212 [Taiwanofungus camphoratus]|nr:hypothetical protein AcV5_005125 [Antrodia cinnamomea]KAI0962373.1 hypothetical protein AcV7_001230 [Antrodia cinnamomea]KAI0964378.1 hypothetical protein AcW1_001212 [Antrodia cinnamomea]
MFCTYSGSLLRSAFLWPTNRQCSLYISLSTSGRLSFLNLRSTGFLFVLVASEGNSNNFVLYGVYESCSSLNFASVHMPDCDPLIHWRPSNGEKFWCLRGALLRQTAR